MRGDLRDRASGIDGDVGGEAEIVVYDCAPDRLQRRIDGDGPAARKPDHANPLGVDRRMSGEQAQRRQRAGGVRASPTDAIDRSPSP